MFKLEPYLHSAGLNNQVEHSAAWQPLSRRSCHRVAYPLGDDVLDGRSCGLSQKRDEAVLNFDELGWAKRQLLLHLSLMA